MCAGIGGGGRMRQERWRPREALRMQDVAAHAGVSPMSVSRALRDPSTVSEAMHARVLAAVRETGYVPNHLAGSLSSQRSSVVGLVVPGISNSLYAGMAQAIAEELGRRGLHLLIASCGHDAGAEEAAIGAFLAQRVCGLILHATRHTAQARALVRTAGIPTVEIGRLTRAPLDMCVGCSGAAAAKAMVLHLGRSGHRRIGFASLPLRDNDRAAERRRGFLAGLRALGREAGATVEATGGLAGGADALVRLLDADPELDAVFFAADVMAVGALFECQRRGWAVPGRLAIASFDDVELLSHVVPTVTTLRIPRDAIGRRAAAMLVERLDGPLSGPAVVDLGFSLVERQSTRHGTGAAAAAGRAGGPASGRVPGGAPDRAPDRAWEPAPDRSIADRSIDDLPDDVRGHVPGSVPGSVTGPVSARVSGTTSGRAAGPVSGHAPGGVPGSVSGDVSGAARGGGAGEAGRGGAVPASPERRDGGIG